MFFVLVQDGVKKVSDSPKKHTLINLKKRKNLALKWLKMGLIKIYEDLGVNRLKYPAFQGDYWSISSRYPIDCNKIKLCVPRLKSSKIYLSSKGYAKRNVRNGSREKYSHWQLLQMSCQHPAAIQRKEKNEYLKALIDNFT